MIANAYIKPSMVSYLDRAQRALASHGFTGAFYVMTLAGGMTTGETARQFPIRLVESGSSGGAILAANLAQRCGIGENVSFYMGGTTAKFCMIDKGKPLTSRSFEAARAERFTKGSGMPLRIPAIEMIEIGAGGHGRRSAGSIVHRYARRGGYRGVGCYPRQACYYQQSGAHGVGRGQAGSRRLI